MHPLELKDYRPLGQLQSPQGQAAFADYIPSIARRENIITTVGIQDIRRLPASYPWAGTVVKDTFYGSSGKPQRPSGTTAGDTMANYFDVRED